MENGRYIRRGFCLHLIKRGAGKLRVEPDCLRSSGAARAGCCSEFLGGFLKFAAGTLIASLTVGDWRCSQRMTKQPAITEGSLLLADQQKTCVRSSSQIQRNDTRPISILCVLVYASRW
jgi:hypothetical protein